MNLDQIKQRLVEISRKRVDPDPLLDETLRLASALAQQNQQLHNQLRGARFVFAQITRRRQN